MASGARHYAIMSPRELKEHVSFNTAEAYCSMLPVGHLDCCPKYNGTFLEFQLIFFENLTARAPKKEQCFV
jgi:hypothetical protein